MHEPSSGAYKKLLQTAAVQLVSLALQVKISYEIININCGIMKVAQKVMPHVFSHSKYSFKNHENNTYSSEKPFLPSCWCVLKMKDCYSKGNLGPSF
jgi:hypothetical protein